MDKKKVKKQNDSDIQSTHLREKTGKPFAFGCKINVIKKEETKHKINEDR